jgi:hypothetical protein
MQLDETQKQRVSAWMAEELKLSDIQKRLETEFGLRLTYLDVRMLLDDLRLVPKDVERPKAATLKTPPPAASNAPMPEAAPEEQFSDDATAALEPDIPLSGKVSLSIDKITRPGAVVSGQVTFSDSKSATWYLDQTGRLGLATKEKGYKPSAADLGEFQVLLERELQKFGG